MPTPYDPKLVAEADDLAAARAALARPGRSPTEFANRALLRCQSAAMARLLLDAGADVEFTTRFAGPPLPGHARLGRLDVVAVLLDAGADPNGRNLLGTALSGAIVRGHGEVARLLLERGADLQQASRATASLLGHAAMNGDAELVRALTRSAADVEERCSVLFSEPGARAAVVRFSTAQRTVVKAGTALHVAAWFGKANVAAELLASGARADALDLSGRSPLAIARRRGHARVASLLVRAHSSSKTPAGEDQRLVRAIQAGDLRAARAALANGARPDALQLNERRGAPVLVLAAERGDLAAVELLLDAGANHAATAWRHEDASLLDTLSLGPATARVLESAKVPMRQRTSPLPWSRGLTAVDAALHAGHVDVARLLLRRGATSESALVAAAIGGHADSVQAALATDPSGRTGQSALLGAAVRNQETSVEALLAAGVSSGGGLAPEGAMTSALLGLDPGGHPTALRRARARAARAGQLGIVRVIDEQMRGRSHAAPYKAIRSPTITELRHYSPRRVHGRLERRSRAQQARELTTWLARNTRGTAVPIDELRAAWALTKRSRRALDWAAIDARADPLWCMAILLGARRPLLVVLPTNDPLDAIGLVCRGEDRDQSPRSVLRFLHELHAEFGIRPRRLDRHYVEVQLRRLPSADRAASIAAHIRKLCPDLPEDVDPRPISGRGEVVLWWGD